MTILYHCAMMVPPNKTNPDFSTNNVFELLKLSSYWLDEKFKKKTVDFITRNFGKDMCKTLVSRLFEEGFNDPTLKPILQNYSAFKNFRPFTSIWSSLH